MPAGWRSSYIWKLRGGGRVTARDLFSSAESTLSKPLPHASGTLWVGAATQLPRSWAVLEETWLAKPVLGPLASGPLGTPPLLLHVLQ